MERYRSTTGRAQQSIPMTCSTGAGDGALADCSCVGAWNAPRRILVAFPGRHLGHGSGLKALIVRFSFA